MNIQIKIYSLGNRLQVTGYKLQNIGLKPATTCNLQSVTSASEMRR